MPGNWLLRNSVWLAGLGLFSLGLTGSWRPSAPPAPLAEGQPSAVAVEQGRAQIELDFTSAAQYLLIVSSLADGAHSFSVALNAEPIPESPIGRLSASNLAALEPLEWPNRRRAFRSLGSRAAATRIAPRIVESEEAAEAASVAAEREFYLHVTDGALEDPNAYVRIRARRVGESRTVRVYLDGQQTEASLARHLVSEILQKLDEAILPALANQLGTVRDIDCDGKLCVLLTPWLGRLQGGRTALEGLVRSTDFRLDLPAPYSNRGDMLYLNAQLQPGPRLTTLLAHEVAHVVSFSARSSSERSLGGLPDEEDWLNEAVAHLSENLNGGDWSNLDHRISRFLNEPNRFPLVVPDYYRAGLWREGGCRGANYLFLRWCVEKYGTDLLRDLLQRPATGIRNLEGATGVPFAELYRHWTVALWHAGLQAERSSGPPPIDGAASVREPRPELPALDLRGKVGRFGLAGPRVTEWNVAERLEPLTVRGTATSYVRLSCPTAKETRRISLQADADARLQVTILKLPADAPQIQAQVCTLAPPASTLQTQAASSATTCCRIQVTASMPGPWQVERISAELLSEPGPKQRAVSLAAEELESPAERLGDSLGRTRTYLLELPRSRGDSSSRWLIKVVARDAQGRRAVAWANFSAPSEHLASRRAPRHARP